MEVKFSKPFEKDLRAIQDQKVILKVDEIITKLAAASSLVSIENI